MKSRKPRWYIVAAEKAAVMGAAGFATKFEREKWWVLAEAMHLMAFGRVACEGCGG